MERELEGMRIAILVENGFEEVELYEPRAALDAAGAVTQVVSPVEGKVRGWKHTEWGGDLPVDVALEHANPDEFDALMLPGGVMNPDRLRMNPKAVDFVRAIWDAGKPIAAICHAPWMLIDAGIAQGRRLTSWPSLMTDLKNAGASWQNQMAVRDGRLVTSRKPDDIPQFNRAMLELFQEARGQRRAA
jgi:protease I